jgi:hypothetical protein
LPQPTEPADLIGPPSHISGELVYDTAGSDWRLLRIGAKSGPFELTLDRD